MTQTLRRSGADRSGEVASYPEKRLATAAGRAVPHAKSVTRVFNTITIWPVAIASGIKAAITVAFVRNTRIESRYVTVTAEGGVVTTERSTS